MSAITTHVLDLARGRPAQGLSVVLESHSPDHRWREIGSARTDADGRVPSGLSPANGVPAGSYRLRFDTGTWFRAQSVESFYPEVEIAFLVRDAAQHYHVPLLLSPFGYSTYRGS